MSIRKRATPLKHQFGAAHLAGVVPSDYWDYQPGERVRTVDGLPGVVASVDDGPFPGTESYNVTLENGLGGGEYTANQLSRLPSVQQATAAEVVAADIHLASDDYPELGTILHDRPDIAAVRTASLAEPVEHEAAQEEHHLPLTKKKSPGAGSGSGSSSKSPSGYGWGLGWGGNWWTPGSIFNPTDPQAPNQDGDNSDNSDGSDSSGSDSSGDSGGDGGGMGAEASRADRLGDFLFEAALHDQFEESMFLLRTAQVKVQEHDYENLLHRIAEYIDGPTKPSDPNENPISAGWAVTGDPEDWPTQSLNTEPIAYNAFLLEAGTPEGVEEPIEKEAIAPALIAAIPKIIQYAPKVIKGLEVAHQVQKVLPGKKPAAPSPAPGAPMVNPNAPQVPQEAQEGVLQAPGDHGAFDVNEDAWHNRLQGSLVERDESGVAELESERLADAQDMARQASITFARIALRDFTAEEQEQLINEGALDGTVARNLDQLDLEGTHYAYLDEKYRQDEGQADAWFL